MAFVLGSHISWMLAFECETINSLPSFCSLDKQENISDSVVSSGGKGNVLKEKEMCEAAEGHGTGCPIVGAMKALTAGWKQTAEHKGLYFGFQTQTRLRGARCK